MLFFLTSNRNAEFENQQYELCKEGNFYPFDMCSANGIYLYGKK